MRNARLRDALLRKGIAPITLAGTIGVDPKTVERWVVQGRVPYPRYRFEIAALLQETESYLWPEAVAANKAAELAQSELIQIYPRRSVVPLELWHRLLDESKTDIGILAFAGLFLPEQHPALIEILDAKGQAGATIELLLGDPQSRAVAQRGAEEAIGDAMAAKIHNVMVFYSRLAATPGVSLRLHSITLYNSIFRFDDEM